MSTGEVDRFALVSEKARAAAIAVAATSGTGVDRFALVGENLERCDRRGQSADQRGAGDAAGACAVLLFVGTHRTIYFQRDPPAVAGIDNAGSFAVRRCCYDGESGDRGDSLGARPAWRRAA